MSGVIPSLPQYALMAWCSVKEKHRDKFTFMFYIYFLCTNEGYQHLQFSLLAGELGDLITAW
jgi:hypothetical protein